MQKYAFHLTQHGDQRPIRDILVGSRAWCRKRKIPHDAHFLRLRPEAVIYEIVVNYVIVEILRADTSEGVIDHPL